MHPKGSSKRSHGPGYGDVVSFATGLMLLLFCTKVTGSTGFILGFVSHQLVKFTCERLYTLHGDSSRRDTARRIPIVGSSEMDSNKERISVCGGCWCLERARAGAAGWWPGCSRAVEEGTSLADCWIGNLPRFTIRHSSLAQHLSG